jgi:hypothetical protein
MFFHEVFRGLEWLFEMFRKNVVSCNYSAVLYNGRGSADKW